MKDTIFTVQLANGIKTEVDSRSIDQQTPDEFFTQIDMIEYDGGESAYRKTIDARLA